MRTKQRGRALYGLLDPDTGEFGADATDDVLHAAGRSPQRGCNALGQLRFDSDGGDPTKVEVVLD
jgi:hypothetical protein